MNTGFWDEQGLAGVEVPALIVAGGADGTSGYHNGIRKIFEQLRNSQRFLLTFEHAGHSAAAPSRYQWNCGIMTIRRAAGTIPIRSGIHCG
jgi:predicted dienelactone hydrolase